MNDTKSPKPFKVTSTEWADMDKLNARQEALVQYSVLGYPTSIIAEKLGYTPQHVCQLMKNPKISNRVKSERETRFNQLVRTQEP